MPNFFKPAELLATQQNFIDPRHEKKYSDEDILLLIKFIVKEFAKVVQKWFYSQPPSIPGMQLPGQQANTNQLLLQLLLNKENAARQQDTFVQTLLQPSGSNFLLDMVNQIQQSQGASAPATQGVAPSDLVKEDEPKENLDDIKTPESDDPEIKDEVNTVQSSEGRTDRKESISEDTQGNKKISLAEAYSILNKNAHLQSLFKNFSSFK